MHFDSCYLLLLLKLQVVFSQTVTIGFIVPLSGQVLANETDGTHELCVEVKGTAPTMQFMKRIDVIYEDRHALGMVPVDNTHQGHKILSLHSWY